jgi:hypothetical protein
MQLLYFFNKNQLYASFDFIKELQDFVRECQKDRLLYYLVTQSFSETYAKFLKTHIINKLDEIINTDLELVGKNFDFNFDILGEIKKKVDTKEYGDFEPLHKFKGLCMVRNIVITNIETDGEIENYLLESVLLKTTRPGITYMLKCHNIKNLYITGLQFTNTYNHHLTKLSLTRTDLNARFINSISIFSRDSLTDFSLIDVTLKQTTYHDLFRLLSPLKNLKNIELICALIDEKKPPQNTDNVIPPDFVKKMNNFSYLHLSGMPNMKLNYMEFITNISSNAIKNIDLEIHDIEEQIGETPNPFMSANPEYKLQYEKLKEFILSGEPPSDF